MSFEIIKENIHQFWWSASWGSSITWTSWTWLTTTIWNSASAWTIGQSIVIWNTQTQNITWLSINTWTSSRWHTWLLVSASWASSSQIWIDIAMSTTWTWIWLRIWHPTATNTVRWLIQLIPSWSWSWSYAIRSYHPSITLTHEFDSSVWTSRRIWLFTNISLSWTTMVDNLTWFINQVNSEVMVSTTQQRTKEFIVQDTKRTSTITSWTLNDNFNFASLKRTSIQNWTWWTFTSQWSVLKLENVATQTAWTLTDTVNVLNITQSANSAWAWIYLSTSWTWKTALKFDTWFTSDTAPAWVSKYIIVDIWWTAYKILAQAVA